jgi:hypothetical protein
MLVIPWDNVPEELRNALVELCFRPSHQYQ